jgi:hypothetical protein
MFRYKIIKYISDKHRIFCPIYMILVTEACMQSRDLCDLFLGILGMQRLFIIGRLNRKDHLIFFGHSRRKINVKSFILDACMHAKDAFSS